MNSRELLQYINSYIEENYNNDSYYTDEELNNRFLELFEKSQEEKFYWQLCSFQTYKDTFDSRLKAFLEESIDANSKEFVLEELSLARRCWLSDFNEEVDTRIPFEYGEFAFYYGYEPMFLKGITEYFYKQLCIAINRRIDFLLLHRVMLKEEKNVKQIHQKIFKKPGYQLFLLLEPELQDLSPKARYSYLYHFLDKYIICSQLAYRGFINDKYNVQMSRIQKRTIKYYEQIKPLLQSLLENIDLNRI